VRLDRRQGVGRLMPAQPARESTVNPSSGPTTRTVRHVARSGAPRHVQQAPLRVGRSGRRGKGAGAGTSALGFKGGIGTSSRRIPAALGGYTVGVLVQSNFGGILVVRRQQLG
jgi:D-aminopeptidase